MTCLFSVYIVKEIVLVQNIGGYSYLISFNSLYGPRCDKRALRPKFSKMSFQCNLVVSMLQYLDMQTVFQNSTPKCPNQGIQNKHIFDPISPLGPRLTIESPNSDAILQRIVYFLNRIDLQVLQKRSVHYTEGEFNLLVIFDFSNLQSL